MEFNLLSLHNYSHISDCELSSCFFDNLQFEQKDVNKSNIVTDYVDFEQ